MKENEPRKIALVGTSRIGKTELLNQLESRHDQDSGFAFVPEAARLFFTAHPEIPQKERFSARVQGQVQDMQWDHERMAINLGATTLVCDRSVLDAVVYTRANGELEGSEELFTKIASWVATYTKIFLLDPQDIPYEKDDLRQEEETTRQKNHEAFIEVFEEKGIPFELLSGTIEERLARLEDTLLQ